jgi:hypothetical protein
MVRKEERREDIKREEGKVLGRREGTGRGRERRNEPIREKGSNVYA